VNKLTETIKQETKTLKKTVDKVIRSFASSDLFSETYFTTPFSNPNVENASKELMKFRKLPTNAIPLGPTKMAITLEVTNPTKIFIKILILFKEVTLNKLELTMFLIKFN
jgi:hypothetical protein